MLPETKMLKDKQLLSGRDTTDGTKDGELSIKTRLKRSEVKDGMLNLDSTLPDHSTSDQDFQ
jgi:hypothetical protein